MFRSFARALRIDFAQRTEIVGAVLVVPLILPVSTHGDTRLWTVVSTAATVAVTRLSTDPLSVAHWATVSVAHGHLDDGAVRQNDFPHEVGFDVRVDSVPGCPVTTAEVRS